MSRKSRFAVFLCFTFALITLVYYLFLCILPNGRHFGVSLVGLHSIIFFIAGLMILLKYKYSLPRKVWMVFQLLIILFAIWLSSFGFISYWLLVGTQNVEIENPQFLVILGAGLNGNQPSLTLQERLETGVTYLQVHQNIPVIVTGGQGPGETVSEAQAMRTYLLQRGISKERIILENRSQSTMENFLFTAKLLKEAKVVSPVRIIVVTSDFHLFRAKILAERNGFVIECLPAPTPRYLLPANLLREYFALVKSLIFDRL